MNTVELWKSSFGDDYTRRNEHNTGARYQLWKMLLPKGVRSVLEVGSNSGQNLEAIANLSDCDLYACEPNNLARWKLEQSGLVHPSRIKPDTADKISFADNTADLVFTCGVMIHIPTDKLEASMREIYRTSAKYIICGEYFAPKEEAIPYRGRNDALWRRDYGSLYMDLFPNLKCTGTVFAWHRMTGLDNLTFWVFEK
jgi:pseudaminic acid biosynthesis-associated methylase